MSSSGPPASTLVQLDDSDLQFHTSSTHTFAAPDSAVDPVDEHDVDDDRAGLLGQDGGAGAKSGGGGHIWSMSFYQQFFDVDTDEVRRRLAGSLLPRPQQSFLRHVLRRQPDLYGPFWICVTLIISVGVAGNLASYFQSSLQGHGDKFQWHYDFHKITMAATAVFSYAWLVPCGLYGFLWWTSSAAVSGGGAGTTSAGAGLTSDTATLTFLDLLCLYGYSLTIFIPVSVLWLIQSTLLQWLLVVVGAGLSGGVVVLALWPVFKEHASRRTALILILVVVGLHLLLACGFMLYFFHVPAQAAVPAHVTEKVPVKAGGGDAAQPADNDAAKAAKEAEGSDKKEKRTAGTGEVEEGGGGGGANDVADADAPAVAADTEGDSQKIDERKKAERNPAAQPKSKAETLANDENPAAAAAVVKEGEDKTRSRNNDGDRAASSSNQDKPVADQLEQRANKDTLAAAAQV